MVLFFLLMLLQGQEPQEPRPASGPETPSYEEIQKLRERIAVIEQQNKPSAWKEILKYVGVLSLIFAGLSYRHSKRTAARNDQREAKRLLHEAWDLLSGSEGTEVIYEYVPDRNQLELAKRKIKESMELWSGYAMAHLRLGNYYDAKGDWDQAVANISEAIRLDRTFLRAIVNRGNVYKKQKDYERALQDYNEAIRLDPKYVIAYSNRGNVYYGQKDYHRALSDYNEAIRLDPKFAIAYNNRGLIYRELKDYDRALQDYDEAIRLNPAYALAYANRGNVCFEQDDYERALEDYSEAIRLDPNLEAGFKSRLEQAQSQIKKGQSGGQK